MLARPRTMICLWPDRGGTEPNRKTKLSSNIWVETFSLPRNPPLPNPLQRTYISLELSAVPGLGPGWREPHIQGQLQHTSLQQGDAAGGCGSAGVAGLPEEVLKGSGDERCQAQGRVELQ